MWNHFSLIKLLCRIPHHRNILLLQLLHENPPESLTWQISGLAQVVLSYSSRWEIAVYLADLNITGQLCEGAE